MENLNLSDFFTTKGQATDFAERLSRLSAMIYTTDFNLESALMQLFGIQKKEKIIALLRDQNVGTDSPTTLKDFITKIQTTITTLPVLSITLAFEPTGQTLKAISDWFVMNMKKQVLFDFVVDPRLIAGASITYKGKFKDYSFQLPVQEMLAKFQTTQQPMQPSQTMQQSVSPTTS